MSSFEFDPATKLDRHRGDAAPKRGRPRKPPGGLQDTPRPTQDVPTPERDDATVVDLVAALAERQKGSPRNGRWEKRRQQFEARRDMVAGWAESNEWMPAFILGLTVHGSVSAACDIARINRKTVYNRRDEDAEFRDQWDEALVECRENLEAEIMRRAVEGDPIYTHYQGHRVCLGRRKSDLLAMFMMKKLDPSYREAHTGDKTDLGVRAAELMAQFLGSFTTSAVQVSLATQQDPPDPPEPPALEAPQEPA